MSSGCPSLFEGVIEVHSRDKVEAGDLSLGRNRPRLSAGPTSRRRRPIVSESNNKRREEI